MIPTGAVYVTSGTERRSTGTYYTPKALTEEIVTHALEPVVYRGPAEGTAREDWELLAPAELLELKVCDPAMGSGAFLVQAVRWLVRAPARGLGEGQGDHRWSDHPRGHRPVRRRPPSAGPDGPAGTPRARPPPGRRSLRLRRRREPARRRDGEAVAVARHAGAGQPAVLVRRPRPSRGRLLLGITDVTDCRRSHLDPRWPRQASLDLGFDEIEAAVERALTLGATSRRSSCSTSTTPSARRTAGRGGHRAGRMRGCSAISSSAPRSRNSTTPTRCTASEVAGRCGRCSTADAADVARGAARTELRDLADDWLVEHRRAVGEVKAVEWSDRDPFHWALEFPEVWERGGFDAIVGNPPFQGGKKISGALGGQYRNYLVTWLAGGVRGHADLVAYFFLRAARLSRIAGGFGLIATNTVAQGDSREVGLDQPRRRWLGIPPRDCKRAMAWWGEPGDGDRVGTSQWVDGHELARPRSGRRDHAVAGNAESCRGATRTACPQTTDTRITVRTSWGMGFVLTTSEAEGMLARGSTER